MRKILLAYDGTPEADIALDRAAELAKALTASVGVVSVVPFHPGRIGIDPWDDTTVHTEELLKARERLTGLGITPELHRPVGDPAAEIERLAEEHGYDTIVVGARDLGALARVLQGSVSEHVATHAHATVVIAR
ncbi:MAG: hypothetical protein A2X23_06800 [Chloroflexi bacterium GWC2_73_18]|nr:MAG: hypothetical protein A2X23_06800 [Chloroflexi bacterium GWC2_73_18]